MGIIDDTQEDSFLKDLTFHRSVASVPFGSRYRLIDFILSNMVNSGIRNIGILVKNKHRSLLDHLGPGKEWDLDRKRDGLFLLPPAQNNGHHNSNSNIPFFKDNLDYLYNSRQEYVIFSSTNIIYNLNFKEVFSKHKKMGADLTIISHDIPDDRDSNYLYLKTSKQGWITELTDNPDNGSKISLETYILKKSLLIDIIDYCISHNKKDFVRDGIAHYLGKLRAYAYHHNGYAGIINSIQNYFKCNMDLLNPEIWKELFSDSGVIYTKVKDEPPTKFSQKSKVINSLLANGCIIEGHVENSIIFRGVRVHKNAKIKNSIIMQKCKIEENAVIENAILDKNVIVNQDKKLIGDLKYPIRARKKSII